MPLQTQTTNTSKHPNKEQLSTLSSWIKSQALELGFGACGIARPDTRNQIQHLKEYLAKGYEGDMKFLHEHHDKRNDPTLLVENTKSIICVRLDYLTSKPKIRQIADNQTPNNAIIARYARGRDYHKVMRGLLKILAKRIEVKLESMGLEHDFTWRPFADSAPIFEKVLAENAGLGWTGKHSLLINRQAGSFFALGELFTSLELPFDKPDRRIPPTRSKSTKSLSQNSTKQPENAQFTTKQSTIERSKTIPTTSKPPADVSIPTEHCGRCTACIDICPTQAIVKPYMLDARRCIAYQTIENKGTIPIELRSAIGNRVFGCDDCQLICPWNGFAKIAVLDDFKPRHQLDDITLLELWKWKENEFLDNTAGSPLRRTGYHSFMRNVALGLGNAPYSSMIVDELIRRKNDFNEMVAEHIEWAISAQEKKK